MRNTMNPPEIWTISLAQSFRKCVKHSSLFSVLKHQSQDSCNWFFGTLNPEMSLVAFVY